jgi:HK97 family phage portal protein
MKKPTVLDKVANLLGYVKSVSLSTLQSFGLPSWGSSRITNYLNAYAGWVYACVNARARDVSQVNLRLFKVKNRNTGEVEEIVEHDLLSLMRKVNPFTTKRQLIFATQAYKDLAGESFWYLEKKGTNIIQIWTLRPDWITILTSKEKFIAGYEYRVAGDQPITIKPDQIVHHRTFNPTDPYRGMSVVKALAVTVDTEMAAEEYNRKFFENSAVPAVVMETEQKLDPKVRERMKADWYNEFGGSSKSNKLAITEGGLTIKPFQISNKEMDFLAGLGYNRDKIFALFGVPKTVLGMTEDVTVSNAEATDYVFSKRIVKPLMEEFVDTINEFLVNQYKDGDNLFFGFDDPTPENVENKLRWYETMFKVGAVSPNEIRGKEGLDEVEGLDGFYVPLNVQNVTDPAPIAEDEEPIKVLRTMKKKWPHVVIPPQTLENKIKSKVAQEIKDEVVSMFSKTLNKTEKTKKDENTPRSSVTQEQAETFWKAMVAKGTNFEKRYRAEIDKIFQRQEKETITRLDKVAKGLEGSDISRVLISVTAENKLAAQILVPIVKQILQEQGDDTLDFLGFEEQAFDLASATMREFTRSGALKGISNMNKTTKSKLQKQLQEAVKNNEAIPDIKKRIRNVFTAATAARAEKIARTEVFKASNAATLEGYKQSGVVRGKEWFTALDERVCEWCSPMHGKVKALDSNYFHQGESFVGKDGHTINFTLDDVGTPPLHPNCRCTLLPITVSAAGRGFEPTQKKEPAPIDVEALKAEIKEEVKKEVEADVLAAFDEDDE